VSLPLEPFDKEKTEKLWTARVCGCCDSARACFGYGPSVPGNTHLGTNRFGRRQRLVREAVRAAYDGWRCSCVMTVLCEDAVNGQGTWDRMELL
jgi:hypothetical protein